ncbi:MAG: hypothetical protein KBT48_10195 [Firmicutes bacterium]|nr:hypothetical protein [Bacillota bacterium]
MLHIEHPRVKELLLEGNFGLEKESLRITQDGFLSQVRDPFAGEKNIVKDFSECQCEINTNVETSAQKALDALYTYTVQIQKKLAHLEEPEYLWPFSNPPYIRNEKEIPVAIYEGKDAYKSEYREYLSDRYGRYKMVLSGIHINYSFGESLLKEDFKYSDFTDFQDYKNSLYLCLAQRVAAYGWIINALCSASPIMDSSYSEKGVLGQSSFNGMASTRCSELGYWNSFSPIFNYSNLSSYVKSIQRYVDEELIVAPSELYYPVRLKPRGINSLEALLEKGVDHIELRNVDLNPLCKEGLDIRDLEFVQLFLVWLASSDLMEFSSKDQVQAVQNYKNAAHYDLKTVKIVLPDGESFSVVKACLKVIDKMKEFYKDDSSEIQSILNFEEEKLLNPEKRYAWILRKEYEEDFVQKGLCLAEKRQKEAI